MNPNNCFTTNCITCARHAILVLAGSHSIQCLQHSTFDSFPCMVLLFEALLVVMAYSLNLMSTKVSTLLMTSASIAPICDPLTCSNPMRISLYCQFEVM